MSTETPTIPAETARHVLWHYGADGGWQPGSFTQNLMRTIDSADMDHTAILANGFPSLVAAMLAAKLDPDGIAHLQRIAAGEEVAEENPAPQCPEALFNPDTGGLLRCVVPPSLHDWHQTPGGTEWRIPVEESTEVPW